MMAGARPVLLLPLLMLLAACISGASADCKPTPVNTDPFIARLTWTYDLQTGACTAIKQGTNLTSSSPTTFTNGETKTIDSLANDCLHFKCWNGGLRIDPENSYCLLEKNCSRDLKWSEEGCPNQVCQCVSGIYNATLPSHINNSIVKIEFSVDSHYICQTVHGGLTAPYQGYPPYSYYQTAHWPWYPYPHQAYWPAQPSYPYQNPWASYHPGYQPFSGYHPGNYPFSGYHPGYHPFSGYHPGYHPFSGYHGPFWPSYPGWYHPDIQHQLASGTGGGDQSGTNETATGTGDGDQSGTNETASGTGEDSASDANKTDCIIDDNGTTIEEFTWTEMDACRQTVCEKGELVTKNITDYEGCAYKPWDQCVQLGSNITIHEQTTCFTFTCLYNSSTSQNEIDSSRSGCFYKGSCYPDGSSTDDMSGCQTIECLQDPVTGQYNLKFNQTGCYTSEGTCMAADEKHSNACLKTLCLQDENTGQFRIENTYSGCMDGEDGEDEHCRYNDDESHTTANDSCIYTTCKTHNVSRWETHLKKTGNCSVISEDFCKTNEGQGPPGCEYLDKCYPVKTVLTKNNCTQFVCFSNDEDLNMGDDSESLPSWEPRAIGCYGPPGCMKFGEDYLDTYTRNTYRCDYNIGGLGHKYAELHQHCTTHTGINVALGTVVESNLVYYACTPGGLEVLEVDQTVPMPGESPGCGHNPVSNETMYPGNRYKFSFAFCDILPNCSKQCTYFDTPCFLDDVDGDDPNTRPFGAMFTIGSTRCVCTRNNSINNYNATDGSRANTPSLCGQDGVTKGACMDPETGDIRQWGELWVRKDTDPLEICTCDAVKSSAFCSVYMPDVVNRTMTARP